MCTDAEIATDVRSSPTGGNFFLAVAKSFYANTVLSANFILTVKNSITYFFRFYTFVKFCQFSLVGKACFLILKFFSSLILLFGSGGRGNPSRI